MPMYIENNLLSYDYIIHHTKYNKYLACRENINATVSRDIDIHLYI